MDVLREFLEDLKRQNLAEGCLLGLLHSLIARRIEKPDGTLVAGGMTWREVATGFKRVRWEKKSVAELGLDPGSLPPRDRQRFWYLAIAQARVDSEQAVRAGELFAERLRQAGYTVS
jgi:hypothetical protein